MKLGKFRTIPEEEAVSKKSKTTTLKTGKGDYVIDTDTLIETLSKTPIAQLQGLQLDEFQTQCGESVFRPLTDGSRLSRWYRCKLSRGHAGQCDLQPSKEQSPRS